MTLAEPGRSDADPAGGEPTIFVVDDDPIVRRTVRRLLETAELDVTEFSSADAFLEGVDPQAPGCLLLDVRMPGIGGLELLELIKKRGFTLPVIVITGFADVAMAVRALKHGAMEFIEKPFSNEKLLDCVSRAVERDRKDREVALEVRDIERRLHTLSNRERQVLELVIRGSSNKEIASALGIAPKTIEAHRARAMSKMEASSLAELVRMCVRAGV